MIDWFVLTVGVVLGALIGSFLNVVIWRGPAMWGLVEGAPPRGNLFAPRSYCPNCRAVISARRNIPVLSYLLLHGRCADCDAVIPVRYPIVELLGIGAGVFAVSLFGLTISALLAAAFLWGLIVLAAIDCETGFLPDAVTLPLIAVGLSANAFGLFASWQAAFIGAAAGYFSLWLIAAAYKNFRGRDGLGLGDAKLLAAIGAWSGWQMLPMTVFISTVSALFVIGVMRLRGKEFRADTAIRFGPALAFAGVVVFAWQNAIGH